MNLFLLKQIRCTKFFYSTEMTQKVCDLWAEKVNLQIFDVQLLNDMIHEHHKHYPYRETFVKV